ncbi:MAG: recombinase RarA, partial [Spirochaetaceae bacterium]|nr:recombinase RarA [Spirochaetaceae bacterium]
LRGRDPDAALYWLARMVTAGEDPGFIFRRMLISACEDTGLADPMAVSVVESCAAAFDRVGLPEGRYHLAHATLYLATAPKSNSSLAFFDALAAVEKENAEVPNHLKDGNRDAKGFGHGAGYLYPHAYTDHWVAQQYLPDALNGRVFYNPSSQGYENSIRQEVLARREAQIAALLEEEALLKTNGGNTATGKDDQQNLENLWWQTEHFKVSPTKDGGNLTYSPESQAHKQALSRGEAEWRRRAMSTKSQMLQEIRKTILHQAAPARHSRHFIWNIDDGLLIWECMRQSPEGLVAGICSSAAGMKILQQYSNTLEELLRPQLALVTEVAPNQLPAGSFIIPTGEQGAQWEDLPFDRLYLRDILSTKDSLSNFCHSLKHAASQNQLAPGWKLILHQKIPSQGQRLSALLHQHAESPLVQKMAACEDDFFSNRANPLFSWNQQTVATNLSADFEVAFQYQQLSEQRSLTQEEILRWLHPSASAYGSHLAQQLSQQELAEITRLLLQATAAPVNWSYQSACFVVQAKHQQ